MSKPYLITFTPAETFFFGGSVSFDDDYYVQSAKFPSPSTIMGAIRASLLLENGFLLQHRHGRFVPKAYWKEAVGLVGETSLNAFDEENPDFGVIEKISPCFLIQKNPDKGVANAYFPIPNDIISYEKHFKQIKYEFIRGNTYNCGKKQDFIPLRKLKSNGAVIKNKNIDSGEFYGGKTFWKTYINNLLNQSSSNEFSDIIDINKQCFVQNSQVGIGTDRGQTEDGKFYVKKDYFFEDDYAFAVICHLKKEQKFTKSIMMGGEQSVFQIDVQSLGAEFDDHPIVNKFITNSSPNLSDSDKKIAISPLIAKENIFLDANIRHTISTRIESVRMLNSVSKKSKNQFLKTDAIRIIPTGTVFYISSDKSFPLLEEGIPDIIGYNQLL
ncbi:CRISPR-associated family protein [Candidatus Magnetomorum sp. HK-1]|nr:CRISPR-associated family protein [Candidatus Magnetomorum sp. HK-1]